GLMGAVRPSAVTGPALQIPGFPPIGGALGAAAGAAAVSANDLVQSLTRIQQGDVTGLDGGTVPHPTTFVAAGATNVLRDLKATSLGSGMGQTEGMTLDIVIMLFDQI